MGTEDKSGKYLLLYALAFITILLIGSFVVSRDYLDIVYLITLYAFLIIGKIRSRSEE